MHHTHVIEGEEKSLDEVRALGEDASREVGLKTRANNEG